LDKFKNKNMYAKLCVALGVCFSIVESDSEKISFLANTTWL